MSATFVLESTPPLRKAPIGTSLIRRLATERSSNSRTRSTLSGAVGDRPGGAFQRRPVAFGPNRAVRLAAQQVRGRKLEDVLEQRERRGRVGERQEASRARSDRCRAPRRDAASSALISDANSKRPPAIV